MADVLTPEQRARCMSRIRSAHTKPELAVRAMLRELGIRYRLHAKELIGRPDLVIPSLKLALFVHGCFWHRHRCKYGRVKPASNPEFWAAKFEQNLRRDRKVRHALIKQGWRVAVIWECQTKPANHLIRRIERILERSRRLELRDRSRRLPAAKFYASTKTSGNRVSEVDHGAEK